MDERSPEADALSALLRRLACRIRTESSLASSDLARKARLAQISAVESVCTKCIKYLTGLEEGNESLRPPMTVGEIRDLQDAALVEARESKLARAEAETSLRHSEALAIPNAQRQQRLSKLLAAESRLCSEVQNVESQNALASASALRTCVTEMIDLLLAALTEVKRPGLQAGDQRKIALDTKVQIEKVASAWAAWFAKSETQAQSAKLSFGSGGSLDYELTSDPEARSITVSLLKVLKLCRQQARTAAALERIASAVSACDALSALSASIDDVDEQVPSTSSSSAGAYEVFSLGVR